MPTPESVYLEEYVLKFDGGSANTHEIDLELLADSLKAFNKLAIKTNKAINNKEIDIKIKAKAGLREGSVEISLIIGYIANIAPFVPQAINSVKSTITMIKDVIELKKFLMGKPPKAISPVQGGVSITNQNSNVTIVNGNVYSLNARSGISVALDELFNPLDNGIGKMSLIPTNPEIQPTTVEMIERPFLRVKPLENKRSEHENKTLEVLTTNLDGKADKWRFHDQDADCDYSAHINDVVFLRNVNSGLYNFQRGDVLTVNMTEVKKDSGKRKTIDRFIQNVISHTRPETPVEGE